MMFKTKERNIDKANIKIEVLEWQLKWSIETQGVANNERDSALGDARRLRKELRECKESEPPQSYRVGNANEIKTLSDKLYRLQTDYDELMGVFMGSIRERDTLLTDKRNLEDINQELKLELHISNLKPEW